MLIVTAVDFSGLSSSSVKRPEIETDSPIETDEILFTYNIVSLGYT